MLEKIMQECPKAWKELHSLWTNGDIKKLPEGFRNLYDYFDGLGITIEVSREPNYANGTSEMKWKHIEDNGKGVKTIHKLNDTRIEAEWQAFYEAFKIRESQLCS